MTDLEPMLENASDLSWEDFFPYEPRPVQKGLLTTISRSLKGGAHLVLEAANGTGKTVAALSAALPYALKHNLKIIYMARTHSQIDRVLEELHQISKKQFVSGIALRGRESFCLNDLVKDHAKSSRAVQVMCKQLKTAKKCEFYTNMDREEILLPVLNEIKTKSSSAQDIIDICETSRLCPAETARKALPKVNVIACSYMYIFEPEIRQTFLEQLNTPLEDIILIIDEAHNLPDMIKMIDSDNISSFSFRRATREASQNRQDEFEIFIEYLTDKFNIMERGMKTFEEKSVDPAIFLEELELESELELDDEFFMEMTEIGEAIRFKLAKQGKEPQSSLGRLGEFFFRLYSSIGRKDYTHSFVKNKFSDSAQSYVTLNVDSLDPSRLATPVFTDIHASISMSGTIGDPEAYELLLGLDHFKPISNIFPSPYNSTNIQAFVTKELTTLYNRRSAAMWSKMVDVITAIVSETPLNVGLFTPSYAILRELFRNGLERLINKPIFEAKTGMSSHENDRMVNKFKKYAKKGGAILASVLGGRSSEGADFPGDLMQTVIVVGLPYAPPTNQVKSSIEFMEQKFPGKGKLLSYQIPAINRASQAAGRPVRSLEDRAFIVFLDYRYGAKNVSNYLPEWIRSVLTVEEGSAKIMKQRAKDFFASF